MKFGQMLLYATSTLVVLGRFFAISIFAWEKSIVKRLRFNQKDESFDSLDRLGILYALALRFGRLLRGFEDAFHRYIQMGFADFPYQYA
mgnify:CR=1 FL=1